MEIMSRVKNEIDGGCVELDLLLNQYSKGKPGNKLIYTFKRYFDAYKNFMDTLNKDF
jgi:hypothetical protein